MFDGKTFLPGTGTALRKMACMMRPFADAEPVPLAVAILKAKSLTRSMFWSSAFAGLKSRATCVYLRAHRHRVGGRRYTGNRNLQYELPNVPRIGRTPLGAETAVHTHVFILDHHAAGLLEPSGNEERLIRSDARRGQPLLQLSFLAIRRNRQAVSRTDIDARVALDTQGIGEVHLNVAVEAALDLDIRLFRREALLHFDSERLKPMRHVDMLHLHALRRIVVVAVGPLVQTHFRARKRAGLRRPLDDRNAVTVVVHRDRGLVPMLHGPDDVRRAKGRVTSDEHAGPRGHERGLIDDRHIPLVELKPDVSLDPRKRIVLADGKDH